jgi:SOS-response transcriptional repressor LexA
MDDILTPSTALVLKAMHVYYAEMEEQEVYPMSPPSIRQLMKMTNFSSTSVITHHINKLIDAGYCVRGHNRQAFLTKKGRQAELEEVDE